MPPLRRSHGRRAAGTLQQPSPRTAAGFTLIECLVALLLTSFLLLGALAVQAAELRASRRRAVHAVAERALADAYEGLRNGTFALVTGPLALPTTASAFGGAIGVEVEAADTPGLSRVRLVAVYDAEGLPSRRGLEALIYRP